MNNMPPVTKNLIIINIICFFATAVASRHGIDLESMLALHYVEAGNFNLYQLFTYMFMHGDFAHLFFNMFTLWMFGRVLESVWGSQRYLFFYIFCGIGAGLIQEVVQYFELMPLMHDMKQFADFQPNEVIRINGISRTASEWIAWCQNLLYTARTVGASGSIYAILLAFGMMFPNQPMYIIPFPMPIKTKWVITGYIVLEIYLGIQSNDNIAHFAHLGGMIFGFLLMMYWKKKGGNYGGYC